MPCLVPAITHLDNTMVRYYGVEYHKARKDKDGKIIFVCLYGWYDTEEHIRREIKRRHGFKWKVY